MWVTDAIYMPNCHKIVIASTRRDLRFYDMAGNQMLEDYHLYGLNNVPHSLAYHYNEKVRTAFIFICNSAFTSLTIKKWHDNLYNTTYCHMIINLRPHC